MPEDKETKSGMLDEVRQSHAAAKAIATQGDAVLPSGAAPIMAEAGEEAPEKVVEFPAPAEPIPDEVAAAAPPKPAKKIKIGDQEFTSEDEAFAYAEQLESEKFAIEAYAEGLRTGISSHGQNVTPAAQQPPEEDFDAQFYANPKEYLMKVKEQAKSELRQELSAQQKEEAAWSRFFNQNPDLSDQRRLCTMILQDEWETFKHMDEVKGAKMLATKVRSIFQQYVEKQKPRSEMPATPVASVSSGVSAPAKVTPASQQTQALDFVSQLRQSNSR